MSYRNKYGITNIIQGNYYNLDISWDCDDIWNTKVCPKRRRFPVFLFTPDMRNTDNHQHIELNKTQAKKLHKWLTDYLKDCK